MSEFFTEFGTYLIKYGVFLILEKYVWGKGLEKAPGVLRRFYTLLIVLFGWFIFASPDIASPFGYLGSLFSGGGQVYDVLRSLLPLALMAFFAIPLPKKLFLRLTGKAGRAGEAIKGCALILLFVLSLASLVSSDYSPFLYARF